MELTAEQIQENWNILIGYIEKYISSPRKEKLLDFYNKFQERIMLTPASHKKEYHNAMPGGYCEHVIRVIEASLEVNNTWIKFGVDTSTYTIEELVFSALNHDLGKIGDEENESYIPQTDEWRKNKLGEDYMFNSKIPFSSVPDRGLFLLQSHGIQYTFNEMITIQTHDGLYDEGNKKYLMTFMPEQKPRTALPFIVHQADLLAARVEWERDWLYKFKGDSLNKEQVKKSTNKNKQQKALGTVKSSGLSDMIKNL